VIDLLHHLPADPAEHPEDGKQAAGPDRAQAAKGRRGRAEPSSPGDAALVALVRLLARQAAEQFMSEAG